MDRIRWDVGSTGELIQGGTHDAPHGRRPLAQKQPPATFTESGMKFLLVEAGEEGSEGLKLFYVCKCNCKLGFIGVEAHWQSGNIKIPAIESICVRCENEQDNILNSEQNKLDPFEQDMQARLKDAYTEALAKKSPQTFDRCAFTAPLGRDVVKAIHRMLHEGYHDSVIAKELGCSCSTVGTYRRKLGLKKPKLN